MKNNSVKFASKLFKKAEISELKAVSSLIKKYKIVVFAPKANVEKITFAMAEKGAGTIGNYTVCSFRIEGTGTFKGGKGSNPSIGTKGKLETVEEVRLEMVCSKNELNDVISNMINNHPYEEPAYEVYEIISGSKFNGAVSIALNKPVDLKEILKRINKKLDIESLSINSISKMIKNIIIDMDSDEEALDYIPGSKQKTLYINKKTIGAINLTLK